MDEYKPDLVFLQETCVHKVEEISVDNKLGQDRLFVLNSPDQYCDDFDERLQMTSDRPIHGTGIIINIETRPTVQLCQAPR